MKVSLHKRLLRVRALSGFAGVLVVAIGLASTSVASQAEDPRPLTAPMLQAAHNSGQGWLPRLTRTAIADGVTDLRSGIYWRLVEENGVYAFDRPTTRYPDFLEQQGAGMTLTVNAGHPAHDAGHTPHSPAAVQAFAAFVAATVARFPAIHTVEVGNEVNASNFVSGPVREAGLEARAGYHLSILKAVHAAVEAVRPEVRILGGSAHSVSGRYLGDVFAGGGASFMDALALHPYTTPVAHLPREIAYLRRLPGAGGIDIEITEFGYDGPARAAADYMLQSYCAYALSDVAKVTWYPLHPRGDGFASLYTERGLRTDAGAAFHLIREALAGRAVRDAAPDPFTRACAFGPADAPTQLLIWGVPRGFTVAPGVEVRDATGRLSAARALSEARPLLLSSSSGGPVRLGEQVRLAPQTRRADSNLQFGLPRAQEARAPGDAFERLARTAGREMPLVTRPGQDAHAVPWRPYRALATSTVPRLTESYLIPSRGGDGPIEIVHRYRAEAAASLLLELSLAPSRRSEDGVVLVVRAGGEVLRDVVVTEPVQLSVPLELDAGAQLEISVGPGASASGDYSDYRFILSEP